MQVCVYCGSSDGSDASYREQAFELGRRLGAANIRTVYGGGSVGSMGALADGVLSVDGEIVGILPHFMHELEWGHPGLSRLDVVSDMRVRKEKMLAGSDACIALPGGCGTFEELFEALTLKRLGLWFGAVIVVNTNQFFTPMQKFLQHAVDERFMDIRHGQMWTLVDNTDEVIPAIKQAPQWPSDARKFAAVGSQRKC